MDYGRFYLQYVKEETGRFGVEILSWCLMTNHVHFIAVPEEEWRTLSVWIRPYSRKLCGVIE